MIIVHKLKSVFNVCLSIMKSQFALNFEKQTSTSMAIKTEITLGLRSTLRKRCDVLK